MKTFEELGMVFDSDGDCNTCYDNSCHNITTLKGTGEEYSLHISTNNTRDKFLIYANSLVDDGEMEAEFDKEDRAVRYVCQHFNGFKCF